MLSVGIMRIYSVVIYVLQFNKVYIYIFHKGQSDQCDFQFFSSNNIYTVCVTPLRSQYLWQDHCIIWP